MSQQDFKYWAFISYSHADEAPATWLHRSLEHYRLPSHLVGRAGRHEAIPKNLFPVFRDRDELAGSSELGPALQEALRSSRSLIVICSPSSARSHWVNEEIKHFKSLGRQDRVFALIVGGEPHAHDKGQLELECFPEALRFQVDAQGALLREAPVEPIAADLRPNGDGKANAKLKLIAGILGIGFNDLKQRELQARNRRLGFVAALSSVIAALTLVLAIQAYHARNDAQRRQRQAEDLIQFMLGDLRSNLEPIGKLNILGAVGDKAMQYFATLDETDQTDAVIQSRATALRQIGKVRLKQGNLAGATEAFRQALTLDQELVERHPDDAQSLFNVSESQFSVGSAHYSKGEIDLALPWFERQIETMQRLVTLEPDKSQWQLELGNATSNLGAIAVYRGDLEGARSHFDAARKFHQPLVDKHPDNPEFLLALSRQYGWLTHVEAVQREYQKALEPGRAQAALLRRLVQLAPDNAGYRLQLVSGLQQVIYNQSNLQPTDPSAPELLEALEISSGLAKLDPDNVTFLRAHAVSLSYLENAALAAGDIARARRVNQESLTLARGLLQRAPDLSETLDDLLSVLPRAIKLAWLDRDPARASGLLEQALALPLSPRQRQDADPRRWLELHLLGQWIAPNGAAKKLHAQQARQFHERLIASKAVLKPDVMMRFHALNGEPAEAGRWAARLTAVERKHPFLVQFCQQNPCSGK